jgi:hypothetical protein
MIRLCLLAATALALAACSSSPEERPAPIENASNRGGARGAAPTTGAGAAATADRDCFSVRSVTGFVTVDDDTLRLDVGPSRSYELDARGATCRNLRFANAISLEPEAAGTFVCTGDAVAAATIRTDQGEECLIDAVRRLPEPVAAPASTGAGAE